MIYRIFVLLYVAAEFENGVTMGVGCFRPKKGRGDVAIEDGICGCEVTDEKYYVDCESRNLTALPQNLVSHINVLNLANNDITTLRQDDVADIKKLERIILTNNPLHCDCELLWLTIFAHKSRLAVIDGVCHSPSEFRDVTVDDLRGRLNCSEAYWHGDELFYFYPSEEENWSKARKKCVDKWRIMGFKGHLAVTKTIDALNGVNEHVLDHESLSRREYWIGCDDSITEGVFQWVDGSSVNKSLWQGGQPSNQSCGRSRDQDCCSLQMTSGFTLDDDCCSQRKSFICSVGDAVSPMYCPEERTSYGNFNNFTFHWPMSERGTVIRKKCPYGPESGHVERICFRSNITWGSPDSSECLSEDEIDTDDLLYSLATIDIEPGEAKQVSEKLKTITSESEMFGEIEVDLSVDILDHILQSYDSGTDISVAIDVLQTVDNLLEDVDDEVFISGQKNHSAATRLLQTVEKLSIKVAIDEEPVTIETPSVALTIAPLNLTTFDGLSFSVSSSGQSTFLSTPGSSEVQIEGVSSIQLPDSLFENLKQSELYQIERAQFLVYKSDKLFEAADNSTPTGLSLIIAASIGELTIWNLREPVKIKFAHQTKYDENANISCVFWDFSLNNGSGAWSGEGCAVSSETKEDENSTTCECNHLTNFALLVDVYGDGHKINPANQQALSIISYIGCIISLVGTALTLVSLIMYRKRKDKATKITLNLCFALFMALLMFLIGSFGIDFALMTPWLCTTIACLLHFFLLAVLMWMALEAVMVYLMLIKIFETYIPRFLLKFCLIGWGVPFVVMITTVSVDVENYGYHNTICWLSRYPFYVAFLAPLCAVLVFNSIVYCLVIHQICGINSRPPTVNDQFSVLEQLRAAIALMVLLGLTWAFAIFAVGEASLLFNYLFAIFNSLQGLFIFVFHCAMKKEVRKGWKKKFCRDKKLDDRSTGDTRGTLYNGSGAPIYKVSHSAETDIPLGSSTGSLNSGKEKSTT